MGAGNNFIDGAIVPFEEAEWSHRAEQYNVAPGINHRHQE